MNDLDNISTSSPPEASSPRQKRRSHKQIFRLVVIIIFALVTGVSSAFYAIRYNLAKNDQFLNTLLALPMEKRRVNILVMGVDTRAADNGRSDTLMLASLDPATGKAAVMSIPRDTRVQIPGRRGHDKINSAFPFGGPELVQQTVANLLDVEIDHYVIIDFNGFAQIVDTLGGVDIDIPKRMHYVDRAQQLVIDLQPGKQHLNGEQALGYVRFRHDRLGDVSLVDPANDIYDGRVERQLQFVKVLTKQLLQPLNVLRAPTLAQQFYRAIQTDITTAQMVTLANAARRVKIEQMQTFVLPGIAGDVQGVSYWLADEEKAQQIAQKMPGADTVPISVAVFNGTTVTGLAAQVAGLLRQEGYHIVEVGNADKTYTQTQIVAKRDAVRAAEDIAGTLGGKVQRKKDGAEGVNAQVAVIIGADYANQNTRNN